MILVNKKQIALKDLAVALGITLPLEKITKKPLFEINPLLIYPDRANGPAAIKHRNAMEFPAVFNTRLKTGESVEIRYCTSRTPDPKTMGNSEKYSPRIVDFDGRAEFINDDLDKAVYYWLHFFCKQSPFREDGKPFEYELVDDDAKANSLIAGLTLKGKATSHAAALTGDAMIIIAKGMKIPGASSMDPLMVKAQLMQYANDKPAEYLNLAESQVNHVHGLIYDAIDKGIFVINKEFNTKRWLWAMGAKAGEMIVEISSASNLDERDALINHISQAPGAVNEILPVLMNTSRSMNAKSNLESAIEGMDILGALKAQPAVQQPVAPTQPVPSAQQQEGFVDELGDDFDEDEVGTYGLIGQNGNVGDIGYAGDIQNQQAENTGGIELPKTFAEAQALLGAHGASKAPPVAKQLMDSITAGTINSSNILGFIEQNKKA